MRGATWIEDDLSGIWEQLGPPRVPVADFATLEGAMRRHAHLLASDHVIVLSWENRAAYVAGVTPTARWVVRHQGVQHISFRGHPILGHGEAAPERIYFTTQADLENGSWKDANLAGG